MACGSGTHLRSAEELEMLLLDAEPSPSHHLPSGGERQREAALDTYIQKVEKRPIVCQTNTGTLEATLGKISPTRGGTQMGSSRLGQKLELN